MADTIIHLQDNSTNAMFDIKLYDNGDGTYSANLNPFLVIPEDFTETSTISFGEKISAFVGQGVKVFSSIIIGVKTKMFVIIPAEGFKTFIFNRTFKTLEFIKNLNKYHNNRY
jgi:hypothetical protein